MKIAFLDRDGVLNREIGQHTSRLDQFEILPDVIPALQLLQQKGFELVVITNQSGVDLGTYGHKDVTRVHEYMADYFIRKNVQLLEIFYCPHHPNIGNCLCRKPKGLLIEKALAKYAAKPQECIMFGDRERDVAAAQSNGVRGVLIPSNSSLLQAVEDSIV